MVGGLALADEVVTKELDDLPVLIGHVDVDDGAIDRGAGHGVVLLFR